MVFSQTAWAEDPEEFNDLMILSQKVGKKKNFRQDNRVFLEIKSW
jgi:hypothetical protein